MHDEMMHVIWALKASKLFFRVLDRMTFFRINNIRIETQKLGTTELWSADAFKGN